MLLIILFVHIIIIHITLSNVFILGLLSREETIAASEVIDINTSYPKDQCMIDFMKEEDTTTNSTTSSYDGISCINYIAGLCQIASQNKVWISVGGFPEKITTTSIATSLTTVDVAPIDMNLATTITSTNISATINTTSAINTSSTVANTHFLISPEGKIASPLYRKLHLFDAPIVNLFESKTTGKSRLIYIC